MKRFVHSLFAVMVLTAFFCAELAAQEKNTDTLVRNRLRQIALGNAPAVREELPTLLAEHKGDPGVDYLYAILTPETQKSLPVFERIAHEHRDSPWADDAQWRVVQVHALHRDTARAREELQDFRRLYPNSEYLLFASEIVRVTVGLPASFANRTTSATDTASPTVENPQPQPVSSPSNTQIASVEPTAAGHEIFPEQPQALTAVSNPKKTVFTKDTITSASAATQAEQHFTLQIGLFSSEHNAATEMQKLIKARVRADVMEKKLGGAVRYAVIVGDYTSRANAEKARPTVQKICQCLPFVVPR